MVIIQESWEAHVRHSDEETQHETWCILGIVSSWVAGDGSSWWALCRVFYSKLSSGRVKVERLSKCSTMALYSSSGNMSSGDVICSNLKGTKSDLPGRLPV